MDMNFSPAHKVILFIASFVISLIGALYLHFSGVGNFWLNIMLAIVTIIVPLFSGLFIHEERLAKATIALAELAAILALILAVDATAVHDSFKQLCESLNYSFSSAGKGYDCIAPTESASFSASGFSGSFLIKSVFILYFCTVLLGILNIALTIIKWYKFRKK
jgi:hypothetical protein